MTDREWHQFFRTAIGVLGAGEMAPAATPSWCSWTTFTRLFGDAGYWTAGLPSVKDIRETHIADGGLWGQPFLFSDLAHIIIPREFYWETTIAPGWKCGARGQDIARLSGELKAVGVPHRLTDKVLEVKVY